MATLLITLPAVFLIVTSMAIMRGYTISVLWQWFLVPLGLPALSIVNAIGLSLLVSLMTHQLETKKDERETESASHQIAGQVGVCLGSLGIGWILTQFM